jgi:hypothetical protein
MPYMAKLYAYLFVCFTLINVVTIRWFQESSVLFVLVFGVSCSLAVIFIGRWLFGRKEL